jgi:hypothetical protein
MRRCHTIRRSNPAGLKSAAEGFAEIAKDDFDNQRLQFPMYDAFYKFCQIELEKQEHVPKP